jgi:hypothetical protein
MTGYGIAVASGTCARLRRVIASVAGPAAPADAPSRPECGRGRGLPKCATPGVHGAFKDLKTPPYGPNAFNTVHPASVGQSLMHTKRTPSRPAANGKPSVTLHPFLLAPPAH